MVKAAHGTYRVHGEIAADEGVEGTDGTAEIDADGRLDVVNATVQVVGGGCGDVGVLMAVVVAVAAR